VATFLELLTQARALSGPAANPEDLQAVVDDALGRLLLVEGPPVDPVPDYSEDLKRTIVRSPKGKPVAVARTWTTGPWRCLLLEVPSVPMRRPLFLLHDRSVLTRKGPISSNAFRTITNSRTQNFIRRIAAACQALEITLPMGEAAVHSVFGETRTFIAWRSRETDEPFNRVLRGDVDNFAKTILDGLQSAGVVPNDRGVFRLTCSKEQPETWTTPAAPLEDAVRNEAAALRGSGLELETVRVQLRLARAHMARLFPGEYNPGYSIRKDPAVAQAAAQRALELIRSGTPYKDARNQTGAPAGVLRTALAPHLRERVKAGLSLQDLARELVLDTRTASGLLRNDPDLQQLLREHKTPPRPRADATKALTRALKDVAAGTSVAEAARKNHVSPASLYSKINRAKQTKNERTKRKTTRQTHP
jgi:hypothetical protein